MSNERGLNRVCVWDQPMLGLTRKNRKFMSDDNKNRDEDRGGKKNGEFRVPPRTYIIWIAILGAIPLLMVFKGTGPTSADILSQTQFMQAFASNQIVQAVIAYDPQSLLHEVRGKYFKTDKAGARIEAAGK